MQRIADSLFKHSDPKWTFNVYFDDEKRRYISCQIFYCGGYMDCISARSVEVLRENIRIMMIGEHLNEWEYELPLPVDPPPYSWHRAIGGGVRRPPRRS